jgi:hypothetical protein
MSTASEMSEPSDRQALGTRAYLIDRWFRPSRFWLGVRIAVIAVAAASSFRGALDPVARTRLLGFADLFEFLWWLPFAQLLGWPLFVPLFLGFTSLFRDLEWARPDWRHNPFDIYRPLELFDLAAPVFAAGGLATLACAPFVALRLALVGLWMLANGVSLWLSVRLWVYLLRARMRPPLGPEP